MGYWDSAVTTAPEIGHYIHQNAENVGQAATAMGAPAIATGEKAFPHLVQQIEKSGADLKDKVDNDPDLQKPKEISQGPYDMAAFWPKPPSTEGPKTPPTFSSDINKFLTLNGVTNLLGEGKDAVDVGQAIAQQMFSSGEKAIKNDEKYLKNTFNVIDKKLGTAISGGHVFYKVPLGNDGKDEGWHSHLRLWEGKQDTAQA